MKKSWLLSLSFLLGLPIVYADVGSTLNNVWTKILNIGNLGFLGPSNDWQLIGFTRILIWIAVFTIFFAVITTFKGKDGKGVLGFFNKNQALVIAGVIATISAIFLPAEVLLATGKGWATLVSFVLIGLPVAGIAYILWKIPFDGSPDTKGTIFLKLILCIILFWILTVMKNVVRLT